MSRLPQVNGDKGNWGRILNTWLKHIAGFRGVAPARPASGNLPAGVAVNGTGYDTTDQFQSENSGLNFHNDFPDNVPTGFTFIHTLHNRIYRKEGNGWAVLLEGVPSSNPYWSLTGNSGTNPNNNFLGTIDNQPLVIRTSNTERVRIDTNGNVGIGTTNPGAKLDVKGVVATDSVFGFSNFQQTASPYDVYISAPVNQSMGLFTYGVERVRINHLGNVGIGTTTPGADVGMLGGLTINGTNLTQLTVQKNGTSGFAMNVGQFIAGDVSMYDKVGGTWNHAITLRGGNVGIGTAIPAVKLDVKGVVATDSVFGFSNFQQTASPYDVYISAPVNQSMGLFTYGVERVRINHLGNVGIGTTTPSQRLHVVGNFMLVNNGASIAYKDGTLTWSNPSDARLKTNIQPITNALEKITKLRGVSFDWVNQDLHQGDAKSGFLAQEMEQVFPDCVQEIEVDSNSSDAKLVGDGKIKTVGLTTGFFASMVEAIKEQQQIIEGLQKTVAQQQQLIDLQNQKIAQLEQKLEELANKLGS